MGSIGVDPRPKGLPAVDAIPTSRELSADCSPNVSVKVQSECFRNGETSRESKIVREEGTSPVSSASREDFFVSSFPRRGLDHCITAPVRNRENLLVHSPDFTFAKSMSERRETPSSRHRFLDRLSEHEKKKLIIEMVKIQNDGTVEVDITKSDGVASELLDFRAREVEHLNLNEKFVEFNKTIPKLKITMLIVGTRGDVQPFLAIAKRLQEFGHQVRLATHANFKSFVRSAGVDFFPLGGDPRILAAYMARNKGFIPSGPGEISIQRKQLKAIIESLLPACTEPDIETGLPFRAQAIIANPPAYGHVHVAEALGVPLHIFFTMPWTYQFLGGGIYFHGTFELNTKHLPLPLFIERDHDQGIPDMVCRALVGSCKVIHSHNSRIGRPTSEFPHPLARVPQRAGNWLSYVVVDLLIWWGIRTYINDFRKRKLKLEPIAYFSTYSGSISHLPTGYMWSTQLVPKPIDWGPLVDVVGYCFLNLVSKHQPQEEFVKWIEKGSKPIYFGFGSMPLEDPKKITDIILKALNDTGQRGIVARGWGDLGIFPEIPGNIFLLEDCPHDWLFPQCSAVVHHGGAGTTAAGLKAGCPTTIVPFFGDQFFWGDRLHERGLGPAPIPISQLSIENLSNSIEFMLQPEVKAKAMEVAKLIVNEDGVAAAVDAFHKHLPPELPLPTASSEDDENPNPFQWLYLQVERWCCPQRDS